MDRTGFLPLLRDSDDAALRTQPKRDTAYVKRSGRGSCGLGLSGTTTLSRSE